MSLCELLGEVHSGVVELSIGGAGVGSGVGAGAGSMVFIGAAFGTVFFLGFAFFFTMRLAFFFAPFLAFLLTGKQSHRSNGDPVMVIKLA